MKVESSKTNQKAAADRKASFQNKNVNQTNVSPHKTDSFDSAPLAPQQQSKSFAQILKETQNRHDGDEENFPSNRKSDRSAKESADADEAKNEKKSSRSVETREAVEERERKQSDEQRRESGERDGSGDGDANPGFGAFVFPADNKIFNTNSIPAARSILHVADLERIVSAIRAQNLKNELAIVIALKHSVLEGLQIKLTVGENGKLKAEFLAASEQIKNQLDARRHELTAIIRERGINLAEMNVRQGADFSQSGETGGGQLSEKQVSAPDSGELSTAESTAETADNESNNRISYRV
ncbi:MAG: flagellar hook-length control protein FliK [Acidobacteriota bacterium]|nr:flagellar hook-length control protein FliK [Acidobacteriota bacterium]